MSAHKSDDKSDDKKLEAHLFICTNQRDKGKCCADKGASELRSRLKKLCKDPERGWHKRVRINSSGCLDHCDEGIVAVLYPEGRWFTNLTEDSLPELEAAISESLKNNRNT